MAVCWSTPLTTPSKTAPGGFRSVTATESPTKPVAMVANGTHEAVPKFCLGRLLNEAELRKAQRSSTDAFQRRESIVRDVSVENLEGASRAY